MAKILEQYDDIDLYRSDGAAKVLSEKTIVIGYGTPSGWWTVELDVGDANFDIIDPLLKEALAAGRPITGPTSPQRNGVRSRPFYKAMREWVDKEDIRNPRTGQLAYLTSTGNPASPRWLVRMFTEATGIVKDTGR